MRILNILIDKSFLYIVVLIISKHYCINLKNEPGFNQHPGLAIIIT